MSGKFRPRACETVVRTTARAPKTAIPPSDTLSNLPYLARLHECTSAPVTLIRIW